MDRPWIRKLWRQTAWHPKVELPAAALTKTFEDIAAQTAELAEKPYNPGLWASRAEMLARVGYPELAAGDARKAQKLLTAMHNGKGVGLVARKQILETPGSPKVLGLLQYQPFWEKLVKEFHFKNFMILATSLNQAGAFHSYREMCIEARAMYPAENIFSGGLASSTDALKFMRRELQQLHIDSHLDADEQMKSGRVPFRQYPFMPPEYIHRSAELIASANARLLAINAPCVLRASTFGPSAPYSAPSSPPKGLARWKSIKQFFGLTTESDTLGLFAISAIRKGDIILKDPTTWGTNTVSSIVQANSNRRAYHMLRCENCCGVMPVWHNTMCHSRCCNTKYCSSSCLETAKANYHQVLCGKDFSWLTNKPQLEGVRPAPAGLSDTDGQMWLRILATCVQSGLHPLEHPSIAALTPNYESDDDVGRRWSLASHVDVPQRILTTLGVDIFKDLRYDTWVLQTIWARMINNQHGSVEQGPVTKFVSRSVNPLYSFVNHSCEPNAEARNIHETYPPQTAPVIGSSVVAIIAKRDIKPGEEICISYLDENQLFQNRAQRNFLLRHNWLSGDCLCTRCRREARGESTN